MRTHTPDVSVVVAAYNAMPYLPECLDSVINQSMGVDRLELIAVNDGSTDDTGKVLDEYAERYAFITVIHQEASGGAARPRNVGLDHAHGRYVFFLDADDALGEEALARLVRMADNNKSDVIVGKLVSLGNRAVPTAMFHGNQPDADLYESNVYSSLRSQRMFRRAFLNEQKIRFAEIAFNEDLVFGAVAYIKARRISVLSDYDCYYLRARHDGGSFSQRVPIEARMSGFEFAIATVAELVPPGAKRDFLMRRHFGIDVQRSFHGAAFQSLDTDTQLDLMQRAAKLMSKYYTPAVAAGIKPAHVRVRLELVRRGRHEDLAKLVDDWSDGERGSLVVEDGHAYQAMLGFRDARLCLPDELYDVTDELQLNHRLDSMELIDGVLRIEGQASIADMSVDGGAVNLVLRSRTRDVERSFVADRLDGDRFRVGIDLDQATLDDDVWDAHVEVVVEDLSTRARFGKRRTKTFDDAPWQTKTRTRQSGVRPYFTEASGSLSVMPTNDRQPADESIQIIEARVLNGWPRIAVSGRVAVRTGDASPHSVDLVIETKGRGSKSVRTGLTGSDGAFRLTYWLGLADMRSLRKRAMRLYVQLPDGFNEDRKKVPLQGRRAR